MDAISKPTLILSGGEIRRLMTMADYIAAVERGFAALAAGDVEMPAPLHLHAPDGGFHAKAAMIRRDGCYAALKLNGNFPLNPLRKGLPTIQGVMLLCDGADGTVLAVMDSAELTLMRTAAATALAARFCARPESARVAICGAGLQARAQLRALALVLPLREGRAFDVDAAKAARFAADMTAELGIKVVAASSSPEATRAADVIVACTSARAPYLFPEHIPPGCFIAAIGADNPLKNEVSPQLMARAAVVTDLTAQCLHMGDLHHAVRAGLMNAHDVRAELADVITRGKPARLWDEEIVIFDSTGTAVQDVASALAIYERATSISVGLSVVFGAPVDTAGGPRP